VGTESFASAGTLSLGGSAAGNYTLSGVTSNASAVSIGQAALSITALTNTKTYDATTSASATPSVSGLQGSDSVTGLAETYDTVNAGTGKVLSVAAYSVNDGNGGANYAVTTHTNNTGIINPAILTANLIGTVQKISDGTVAATLTAGNYNLTGVITGDSVTLDGPTTGTYASAQVGTKIPVTAVGLRLLGSQAANYNLDNSTVTGAVGVITASPVTIVTAPVVITVQAQASPVNVGGTSTGTLVSSGINVVGASNGFNALPGIITQNTGVVAQNNGVTQNTGTSSQTVPATIGGAAAPVTNLGVQNMLVTVPLGVSTLQDLE
jgi:hypothetical protein